MRNPLIQKPGLFIVVCFAALATAACSNGNASKTIKNRQSKEAKNLPFVPPDSLHRNPAWNRQTYGLSQNTVEIYPYIDLEHADAHSGNVKINKVAVLVPAFYVVLENGCEKNYCEVETQIKVSDKTKPGEVDVVSHEITGIMSIEDFSLLDACVTNDDRPPLGQHEDQQSPGCMWKKRVARPLVRQTLHH